MLLLLLQPCPHIVATTNKLHQRKTALLLSLTRLQKAKLFLFKQVDSSPTEYENALEYFTLVDDDRRKNFGHYQLSHSQLASTHQRFFYSQVQGINPKKPWCYCCNCNCAPTACCSTQRKNRYELKIFILAAAQKT